MTLNKITTQAANFAREVAILYLGFVVGGLLLALGLLALMLIVSFVWSFGLSLFYLFKGDFEFD